VAHGAKRGPRKPGRAQPRIRVVVTDPVAESRIGLLYELAKRHDLEVADDGIAAARLAATGRADVVLLDAHLPDVLDACRWITKLAPEVGIIVLDSRGGEAALQAAMRHGAAAVITETAAYEEIRETIRRLHGGGWPLDTFTARWAHSVLEPLAGRPTGIWVNPGSMRVLRLRAQGLSNGQAAKKLYLRKRTVKKHLRHLHEALREAMPK
jgi:DNA-binding NarL/FixJ family response regulator